MKLLAQLATTFLLLFWPMVMMMSPMMFDAPGSENKRSVVFQALLFLSYPIPLCALFWLFGSDLFGISGRTLTLSASAIVITAMIVFGYPQLLSNSLKGIANSGYSVAENTVYYNAQAIPGAQADSFETLQSGYFRDRYARDSERVYFAGQELAGADPASFHYLEALGDEYWADNQRVYLTGIPLEGALPQHFSLFPDAWGHPSSYGVSHNPDGARVYFQQHHLPDADADSFTVLNDYTAKDARHIFYHETLVLPEADSASFELIEDVDHYGKDNNAVYDMLYQHSGVIEGADPATLQVLGRGYLRDQNHIYFRSNYQPTEILAGADAASFEYTNWDEATQSDARDKHGYFLHGERLEQAER
ncbi:DKNYY domain-containing protein [Bacterioplanoides pacificum]|uniref:DKNYY domain-containing protein n=1 Tax=Bacterioplanoides pacificum TaxID=1171596 RepID=A0ABV7VQ70_9GAMM